MTLTGGLRRAALTVHVINSVGWLGAVLAFLMVAVTGLTSADGGLVRAAALLMAALGQTVIVPLSLLALASSVLQALGTRWGLLDHYWVVIKLIITAVSVLVLLNVQPRLNALADQAAGWPSPTPAQVAQLLARRGQLGAGHAQLQRARREHGVDEQAVAARRGNAARAGVRAGDESQLFQVGHHIADGRRRQVQPGGARQRARTHRLAFRDVALDQGLEQGLGAVVQHDFHCKIGRAHV